MTVGQHVEGGLEGWDEAFVFFFFGGGRFKHFCFIFTPNPGVPCSKLTVLRIFLPMGGTAPRQARSRPVTPTGSSGPEVPTNGAG